MILEHMELANPYPHKFRREIERRSELEGMEDAETLT